MIELIDGRDLLESAAQALVNPVNCVGVMGKGLATQFKAAFPAMHSSYIAACKADELSPGRLHTFELPGRRWIVNFPTKRHWKHLSRLSDVEAGLSALVRWISNNQIESVAIPALGCGLGGLSWPSIRQRIEGAFSELPNVKVELHPPR